MTCSRVTQVTPQAYFPALTMCNDESLVNQQSRSSRCQGQGHSLFTARPTWGESRMSVATSRSAVIFTGPLPAQMGPLAERAERRRHAITGAGWQPGRGVRYVWPTASVTWDGAARHIWIAADDDTHPSDWKEVLAVLRMTGWLSGQPGYTDIGEPGWDRANRAWVWSLPCP